MFKARSRTSDERGQGLVEFALIIPILMLMIMGILDLGRALYAYSVVANSAREGARYGSTAPTDDSGVIAVARAAAVGLDPAQLNVTVSHPGGNSVHVQVAYTFRLVTPLVGQVLGGGAILLSSASTMYTGY